MLMERILSRENLLNAIKRVEKNKGKHGVDEMPVTALRGHIILNWSELRESLFEGTYIPSPVRLVEIPKPDGKGKRKLGIPTVTDRFIQQAITQVLTRMYDPGFSECSFGFRPNRRAHHAVKLAKSYIEEGYRWVVDIDLEKFFDKVNHDRLMSKLAERINDRTLLQLIRRFLTSGLWKAELSVRTLKGHRKGAL